MSKALDDIAAERKRQIKAEGWTFEHDDKHVEGELARAAATYAMATVMTDRQRSEPFSSAVLSTLYPSPKWMMSWLKLSTRRRDLVKAGALIVAEIERLDRESTTGGEQ